MELNVIAIDIAKKVFQLHWVEPDTGCIERLKLKRSQVLPWFANREPALVIMEACGGAHEWGRQLFRLAHDVRLLAPRTVRPFVQRNKTDAADAQAIWTAGRQPGAKFIAVKNDAQQVVLSLQRLRAQLMKMRIMQANELRGLLYEFGVVLSESHRALLKELPAALMEAQGFQLAVAERVAEAPSVQRCCRRRCQQAGQDDLGGSRQGSRLAATGMAGGLTHCSGQTTGLRRASDARV